MSRERVIRETALEIGCEVLLERALAAETELAQAREALMVAAGELRKIQTVIWNSRTAPNVLDTVEFVAKRGEDAARAVLGES